MGGVLEKEDNIIIDNQDSMYYLEISKKWCIKLIFKTLFAAKGSTDSLVMIVGLLRFEREHEFYRNYKV